MPLTSSNGRAAEGAGTVAAAAALTVASGALRRELLLARVRLRRRVDQRLDHLVVGLVPVGRIAPVLAVPRVDAPPMHSGVILARGLERLDHVAETERLDLRGVQAQVLGAPADLLARHHALAELRLRLLDRLDRQHRR